MPQIILMWITCWKCIEITSVTSMLRIPVRVYYRWWGYAPMQGLHLWLKHIHEIWIWFLILHPKAEVLQRRCVSALFMSKLCFKVYAWVAKRIKGVPYLSILLYYQPQLVSLYGEHLLFVCMGFLWIICCSHLISGQP